jgi:hypothetical protein
MDSPESRAIPEPPWLFGRQGLALLALAAALAATFLVVDLAFLAGCLLLVGLVGRLWAALALKRVQFSRRISVERAFCGDDIELKHPSPTHDHCRCHGSRCGSNCPPRSVGHDRALVAQPANVGVQRGLSLRVAWLRWRRRLHC